MAPGAPSDEPSDDPAAGPHQRSQEHPVRDRLLAAAYEAERRTGAREETEEEVRRAVIVRIARIIGGFVLIGIGASLLVLPGPGWLMIVIGLGMLPYAWAERTIRLIRRRVPGIPEEGRIPTRTWVVIGLVTVAALAGSFLFGDAIGRWVSDTWSGMWS
jgi:hypothetical protein